MFFDGNEINIDYLTFLEKNSFDNFKKYDYQDNFINSKYYSVDEGFIKGNMFVNEYKPYKNYKVNTIKATNEKEALLNKLMAYNFAFNDMNLYLDVYPEDKEALEMFKKFIEEYKKLKKEYASKYGPITMMQARYENYEWIKNPWPWDKIGGDMYV